MVTPPPRQNRKHERDRKPFQQQRTNPFAYRNNYNFPGLENAFDSTKKTSPDRQSGVLDMSIGAHAAINEQTRHVAHFGLDGTNTKKVSNQWPGDSEWDHLLDETNASHVSCSSTYVTDIEQNGMHPTQFFVSKFRNNASVLDENEPLDMTCDQSDFFSSSRVGILTTPEKNKHKVDEASRLARLGLGIANKRGKENSNSNYSESISGSTDASMDFNGSGMIGFFNAALQLESNGQHCVDEDEDDNIAQDSFVTYQDPDLSILSQRNSRSTGKSSLEKTSNYSREDLQSSFMSYAEPDLSILSNRDMHLVESKSASSPTASTFGADNEEIFFNIKKYPKSGPKSEFGHSDFDADMSEIMVPGEFGHRTLNTSVDSIGANACLVPATPDTNDEDDDRFTDFDQDTRHISPTVRSKTSASNRRETLDGSDHFLMDKSSCATPQRTLYSPEADIANNFSGGESANWFASSPAEDGYPEEAINTKSTYCDKSKLRTIAQRPTVNQSLGAAGKKVEMTPRSSPIKDALSPPTKSFFSGLSPITNHVRGYSNDDNGNESPLSVTKSLFCTTLTEIQTQRSTEGTLRSHLQKASSAEIFRTVSLDGQNDVRHGDKSSGKNDGYLQSAPRRSGLAERYSRPDRFEDSFSGVNMGVGTSNLDKFDEDYYASKTSMEIFEADYQTRR